MELRNTNTGPIYNTNQYSPRNGSPHEMKVAMLPLFPLPHISLPNTNPATLLNARGE